MASLNLDYYSCQDDANYSDGSIELELLSLVKQGDYDWYQDGRWEVVYHLSHLRQNILNWFPFKEDCSILEIGAGPGALTGLFCQHAQKVVAVDLTKIRCEINYERHKQYDNLEIIVGDINRIQLENKFDYVIVNGVLEYASYMIDHHDPYCEFLMMAASHLKRDGRILLAIENRLGLKYFSGAKEDHTGKCFSGLNGYRSGERVRTFSKSELSELIMNSGLAAIKFYYPYPDYKFPTEILTDESINRIEANHQLMPLDMIRAKLFDEHALRSALMKENVMDVFSNSFLIEVAWDRDAVPSQVDYVKISANRNKAFRITTCIDMKTFSVVKRPLFSDGTNHLKNFLLHSGKILNQIKNLECISYDDGIQYPMINRGSFESILLTLINEQKLLDFMREIDRFRDILYFNTPELSSLHDPEFSQVFGEKKCTQPLRWSKDVNIDLIAGNIFPIKDHYEVIDYEWHIPFAVPLEFALWRMVTQFAQDHSLHKLLTATKIQTVVGINSDTEIAFMDWENHFSEKYVGLKNLSVLSKDVVSIDLDQIIIDQIKNSQIISTIFFDHGEGFSDHLSMQVRTKYDDLCLIVRFESSNFSRSSSIRWDPIEGQACRIHVISIDTDIHSVKLLPLNADSVFPDEQFEFSTFDPQFIIMGDMTNATYIEIHYTCTVIDWTTGYFKLEKENLRLKSVMNENLQLIDKAAALEQEMKIKDKQLNTAINERKLLEDKLVLITQSVKKHRLKSSLRILLSGKILKDKKGVLKNWIK